MLREQLVTRTKEFKNIKALAQMILDQRSDIEQFFLESLEQVRNEIKKKREQEKKSHGLKLPEINKQHNEKVDISELDWEEKEKLLRILFSKMNVGS